MHLSKPWALTDVYNALRLICCSRFLQMNEVDCTNFVTINCLNWLIIGTVDQRQKRAWIIYRHNETYESLLASFPRTIHFFNFPLFFCSASIHYFECFSLLLVTQDVSKPNSRNICLHINIVTASAAIVRITFFLALLSVVAKLSSSKTVTFIASCCIAVSSIQLQRPVVSLYEIHSSWAVHTDPLLHDFYDLFRMIIRSVVVYIFVYFYCAFTVDNRVYCTSSTSVLSFLVCQTVTSTTLTKIIPIWLISHFMLWSSMLHCKFVN